MSFRFSLNATYAEDSLPQFLDCEFAERGIMDFGKDQHRIKVIDQFSGHLSSKVIGSIIRKHSRALIICWGALTGLVQVADVYQNKGFKEVYRAEESKALVRRVRLNP